MPPRRGRPATPSSDPERRQQAQYLRRLGRVIVTTAGPDVPCELRWQERRPFLPYLMVRDVPVWAVSTSGGWRFLWNRYRSHTVTDAPGAARAILADLRPPGESSPDPPGAGGEAGFQALA